MLQHFAVGNVVEVRGTEEGFLGSWYAAHVLEAREARSTVRLRLCYEAFQEDDGSTWEDWIDLRHVRPLPPAHADAEFLPTLALDTPLEINVEGGWWEVQYCGVEAAGHTVIAQRYKAHHTVPVSRLRPAWHWSAATGAWEVLRQPRPVQASPPASRKQRTKL